MRHGYTTAQIRRVERRALAELGEENLMSRAARAVAGVVLTQLASPVPGRSVVLLVGAGNNGGDALYAGVFLRRRSVSVTAVLASPGRVHESGLAAFRRAAGRVHEAGSPQAARVLDAADVLVDGLVGIGARPPLRPAMAELVTAASAAPGRRVAIDVPSGLDPDTGVGDGPVFAADVTVTIGGAKTGLWCADAAGDIRVAPIGMDPADEDDIAPDVSVLTDDDVSRWVPQPGALDDKYSRGVAGVVAGSAHYPGAAVLAVGGAIRTRPGLVRYAGPCAVDVVRAWPEVVATSDMSTAGRVQAWLVGPGLGTDGAALTLLREVLSTREPVVVDADGLTLLAAHPELLAERVDRGVATVLTPHRGEFARLFPDLVPETVGGDKVTATRAAAARSGAVVLYKGHRTVIAAPDGRTLVNVVDSPWLATAGSGDVLAGAIVSLLATGLNASLAAGLAAHAHGRAGRRAAAAGPAGASGLLRSLRMPVVPGRGRHDVAGSAHYGSIGG